MISLDSFNANEPKLLHLAKLWNNAESDPSLYKLLFISDPHELAGIIPGSATYNDWQDFLTDARVQEYIDKVIYTNAGIIVNRYFADDVHLTQADSARLNTAIKYRDDHKEEFAIPVQYIYCQTPLTYDEEAFLPDKEEIV